MISYYPIIDTKREKGKILEQNLNTNSSIHTTNSKENADIFLVGWGDGFMLETIKNNLQHHIPFFWVNCGTLGFLLNNISPSNLPQKKEEIEIVNIPLLKVSIQQKDGIIQKKYCINDIVLGGNILDYFRFSIITERETLLIQGTGLIITNAAGSSAYRLSNWGTLLPLKTTLRGIMGIAAKPFHHKVVQPQKIEITAITRKDLIVGVDGYTGKVEQVEKIIVEPSNKTIQLGFIKEQPFEQKRILLADQKLGG